MEEKKRKHWEADDDGQLAVSHPRKDCACATCKWRLPELLFDDGDVIEQATKSTCIYYSRKPFEILFSNADCEHYEKYDQPKLMTVEEWREKYEKQFYPDR